MTDTTSPQIVISEAYRVFSGHPAPRHLDASPYKDMSGWLQRLTGVPLKDIPAEDLAPYAGSALTTVGTGTDYRYFLPRILHLAAYREPRLGFFPVVIADRLIRAGWQEWSPAEKNAVIAVFEAAFHQALNSGAHDGPDPVSCFNEDAALWLEALAALQQPLPKLLAIWHSLNTPRAILQLADFALAATQLLIPHPEKLGPGWRHVKLETRQTVLAWLLSDASLEQLMRGAPNAPVDLRWQIDAAWDRIENARRSLSSASTGV